MKDGWVAHSNGPPANCWNQPHSRCMSFWNAVRNFHINTNGWSDIAYSFGVCPHGLRFVGRGWDKNQFAGGEDQKADGFLYKDSEWYSCLFFVGDDEPVSEEMKQAFVALRGEALLSNKAGLKVIPHNKFRKKRCPGPVLTDFAASLDLRINPEPENPMAQPVLYFDVFEQAGLGKVRVAGWCYDPDRPDQTLVVHVHLLVGGTNNIITDVPAVPRPDVNQAGIPGTHGFDKTVDIPVPVQVQATVFALDIDHPNQPPTGVTKTITALK